MEKKKKDLRKDSCAYRLLEYLFMNGSLNMKQAKLSEADRMSEEGVRHSMLLLLERGFIAQLLPYGRKNRTGMMPDSPVNRRGAHYILTEEGLRHLGKNDVWMRRIESRARIETSLARARRDADRNDILAMIHGTGIYTFTYHKPSFENFVWLLDERLEEPEEYPEEYPLTGEDELDALLMKGIYYTSLEVKKGFGALGIDDDTFYLSRFIGLVFTQKDIYVIYQFDPRGYMPLMAAKEQELIRTLRMHFRSYTRPPIGIVMAKSHQAAAAICSGRKHGRNHAEEERQRLIGEKTASLPEDEAEEFLRREEERRKRNKYFAISKRERSNTLTGDTKLFEELYVIPVTICAAREAKYILMHNCGDIRNESRIWFSSHQGFRVSLSSEDHTVPGWCIKTCPYTDAAYIPAMDCKVLTEIRNHHARERISVVTSRKMAETVSQILGTCAFAFFDLDGNEIAGVARYKATGFPVEEDRYARISRTLITRAEERKAAGILQKTRITITLREEDREKLRSLGKEHKIPPSALGGKMLEYVLGPAAAGFLTYLEKGEGDGS